MFPDEFWLELARLEGIRWRQLLFTILKGPLSLLFVGRHLPHRKTLIR
jgi:hypothetical protein